MFLSIAFTFFITFFQISISFGKIGKMEKIRELLLHNLEKEFRPSTLRIFFPNNNSNYENIFPFETISSISPILLLPRRMSVTERTFFYHTTSLYFLMEESDLNFVFGKLKSEVSNRRWEQIVLIGREKFIQFPKILECLGNYRKKMGYSVDTDR